MPISHLLVEYSRRRQPCIDCSKSVAGMLGSFRLVRLSTDLALLFDELALSMFLEFCILDQRHIIYVIPTLYILYNCVYPTLYISY